MDQDETWNAGRPRLGHIVLDGDPAPPPKKGSAPNFRLCLLWPNVWMNQDTSWYGGRPWPRPRCVKWGPGSPEKGHCPQFLAHVYCGQTAGWIKVPLGTKVFLGPDNILLDADPAPAPTQRVQPPIFGVFLLWPNGWMDQDVTWYEGGPWPRPHCITWVSSSSPPKVHTPNIRPTSIVAKWLPISATAEHLYFLGDLCKTVRPMLSDHCLSCSVLSCSVLSCL